MSVKNAGKTKEEIKELIKHKDKILYEYSGAYEQYMVNFDSSDKVIKRLYNYMYQYLDFDQEKHNQELEEMLKQIGDGIK